MWNINDLKRESFVDDGQWWTAVNANVTATNSWKSSVADLASLPTVWNTTGDIRQTLDDGSLYRWDGAAWQSYTTWGSGDVVWPASATDNAIARYDSTTGKLIQNSSATIDDNGRISSVWLTATNSVNFTKGADIASATTTDIWAATGNYLDVTGTTTITGLGTVQAGTQRIVRFTWALTLTHNATSLIIPGGSNITTAAWDVAHFVSLGSGNWRCVAYTKADGAWYINIPQNSQSAAYTTVLSDAWKHIYHPSADTTARTFTIDSNANVPYPIGTAITFVNDTSGWVITIAITSDTLVLAGAGTTWSRTLAANWVATAIKVTSTRWIISGTWLT